MKSRQYSVLHRLATESLRFQYPPAHHSATKQFTELFCLTLRAPTVFDSLLVYLHKTKNSLKGVFILWGEWRESNPWPPEPQSGALTNWATPAIFNFVAFGLIVKYRECRLGTQRYLARLKRFELLAHCLEGNCSIQLSYRRIWSGWWESNSHDQLGRLGFYHWTTPASRALRLLYYNNI